MSKPTVVQGTIPFSPIVPPEYQRGDNLEKRFERFHASNPHVFDHLRSMALAVRSVGRNHYGIAALYETLRYTALVTAGEEYKLNNDYRALYARKLMAEVPELAGFFWLRERRAD